MRRQPMPPRDIHHPNAGLKALRHDPGLHLSGPAPICMGNRQKPTEKVLREAVPATGRDYQLFDTEVRGFAVSGSDEMDILQK